MQIQMDTPMPENVDPNIEDRRGIEDFFEGEEQSPLLLSHTEPSCQQQDKAGEHSASASPSEPAPIPSTGRPSTTITNISQLPSEVPCQEVWAADALIQRSLV